MIAVLRYVLSMLLCTLYHSGRVVLAAGRGVQHTSGGPFDQVPRDYGRDLLRLNHISVRATGLDNLHGLGPCVYASNHESWFDVPALVTTLPGSIRFLAKKGLGKVAGADRPGLCGGRIPGAPPEEPSTPSRPDDRSRRGAHPDGGSHL